MLSHPHWEPICTTTGYILNRLVDATQLRTRHLVSVMEKQLNFFGHIS